MNNASPFHFWLYRGLFLSIVLLVALIQVLPISALPPRMPAPDVLPLLAFVWVLRRPEFVPVALIAAVFLLADVIFMRPPGLWAALIVVGSEILRARGVAFREMPFGFEWFLVAVVLSSLTIMNRLILSLAAVETPPFGAIALQLVLTVLIYPLVVGVSQSLFKVRRLTPGEMDAGGRRL